MSTTSLGSRGPPLLSPQLPLPFLNTHPPPPSQVSNLPLPLLTFLPLMAQTMSQRILTLRMCMIMGEMVMDLITHILLLLLLLLIPCQYLLPLLREPGLRISRSGYHPCLLNLLPHPKSISPLLLLFLALLQGNHFHQLDLLLLSQTPSQLREDQLEILPLLTGNKPGSKSKIQSSTGASPSLERLLPQSLLPPLHLTHQNLPLSLHPLQLSTPPAEISLSPPPGPSSLHQPEPSPSTPSSPALWQHKEPTPAIPSDDEDETQDSPQASPDEDEDDDDQDVL